MPLIFANVPIELDTLLRAKALRGRALYRA